MLEAFLTELARAGKSPATIAAYEGEIKRFIADFEHRLGEEFVAAAVLPEDIIEYLRLGLGHLKPATLNRRLSAIKAFFRFLHQSGRIPTDPTAKLKAFREPGRELAPKALSERELRRLLRAAYRTKNPLHRAVVVLLINTGLRASELCNLKLKDVKLSDRKGSLVVRGKGEKVREIPLNERAREALREWLKVRPEDPSERVFIGRRGPLTPASVWRLVTKLGREAGLERLSPHVLRHTFATRLLREAGTDLVLVAAALGHEHLSTTARYTRPSAQELETALEKL